MDRTRKYMDKVKRLKLGTSYASPTNNQLIVAEFLKSEAYDRHLRRLRDVLNRQMQSITEAILRYFPSGF